MRRLVQLAAVAAAVLTAAGCGLDHGVIVGMRHVPASTYMTTQCMPIGSNPCFPMTVPQEDPERWVLDLRDGDDTGSVDVTAEQWASVHPGDLWPS